MCLSVGDGSIKDGLAKAHALNGDGDKALEALRGGSDWTPGWGRTRRSSLSIFIGPRRRAPVMTRDGF